MEANDIEKLTAVWKRVMPGFEEPPAVSSADTGEGDEAVLQKFIQNEYNGAEGYAAMAKKCRRQDRACLFRALEADEREHLARLQTAYFILTGESFIPKSGKAEGELNLSAVRESYLNELADEKAYMAAAEKTKNPRLRAVYETNARDEKRHADMLEKLLNGMMR